MKHSYPVFLVLFCSIGTQAQQLPTMYTTDTVHIQCPWDTLQIIQTYEGWEAYQTMNGEWDGPRDSTICIDLFEMVGNFPQPRIRFDQCDISRPVFARALLDSLSALPLSENNIYGLVANHWPSDWTALDSSANCQGGLCTGVMAAVRVPDSLGTSTLLRWYRTGYRNSWIGTYLDLCIPTERMPGNALREVIFKFTPTGSAQGEYVNLQSTTDFVDQSMNWTVEPLTDASVVQFNTSQFGYNIWGGPKYLVMYEDSTYPAAAHPSYVEFFPVPNVMATSNVDLWISEFATVVFQPFAQLRAGHVLNNDSVFHNLTIINQGSLCMTYDFVEVFWGGGSRYVHDGGDVHLEGAMSCFLFLPGSHLEVADDRRFDYGLGGRGMLGLRAGMDITIRNGAELRIHNMVDIKEGSGATRPGRLETTLGLGSRLSFSASARVHNANSINGSMKWYIYLDGGTCDISSLPPESQEKIVVVQLPERNAGEVTLASSVITDEMVMDLSVRSASEGIITIMDAVGREVLKKKVQLAPGPNSFALATGALRSGSYVISAAVLEELRTARFVKL